MIIVINECELGIDEDDNTLYAGFISNAGVSRNWEIEYDDNFSFDENLQYLIHKIESEW